MVQGRANRGAGATWAYPVRPPVEATHAQDNSVLAVAMSILFVAAEAEPRPCPAGGESPAASPAGSPAASPAGSAATGGYDPNSITGTAILSGWRSSPEEGEALTQALLGFLGPVPEHQGRLPADRRRLPDR